jgi:hypothetical protein
MWRLSRPIFGGGESHGNGGFRGDSRADRSSEGVLIRVFGSRYPAEDCLVVLLLFFGDLSLARRLFGIRRFAGDTSEVSVWGQGPKPRVLPGSFPRRRVSRLSLLVSTAHRGPTLAWHAGFPSSTHTDRMFTKRGRERTVFEPVSQDICSCLCVVPYLVW